MSRIGKKPIPVPTGVTVTIEPEVVRVAGPAGDLEERKIRAIEVAQEDGELLVTRPTDRAEHRALHGLTRSLVANMVEGVTDGFTKTPRDPGRRLPRGAQGLATSSSRSATRTRCRSRRRRASSSRCRSRRASIVKGNSKQQVGEIAAVIRKQRPPEPYKGKGIRYEGEYVARKVGKRA